MERQLVLATSDAFGCSESEQIEKIAKIGWDGVFTLWSADGDLKATAKHVKDCGLFFQSVHAEYRKSDRIWEEGAVGEEEKNVQIRTIIDCAEAGVDLLIMHAIIGMEKNSPTQLGVDRFGEILEKANEYGVRIALENTEGEIYVETLLKAFSDEKNLGFCIDTGHEMCYNHSADLITKYGKRLFSTHLNDNMGQSGENITWLDDWHLLPFDGAADWRDIARRLNTVGYQDALTFELGKREAQYGTMTVDEYLSVAYDRAKKFRKIVEEER